MSYMAGDALAPLEALEIFKHDATEVLIEPIIPNWLQSEQS